VQRRAKLVNFTKELFEQLREEERKKAEQWLMALQVVNSEDNYCDLTFASKVIFSNTTIPMMILDKNGKIIGSKNLPPEAANDTVYVDSLKTAISLKREPLEIPIGFGEKQFLYYDDSFIFAELQVTLQDLINSFISETVINSASVPVIMTDSTRLNIVRYGNIDTMIINSDELLAKKLTQMEDQYAPIEIDLPLKGKHYIFHEDSNIIVQLQYYPVVQLVLIAVFLLVAYLIFSTFRKAEQNQVWVGMAKETAHQLGTPLSSLMAWMTLLEARGVDKGSLDEIQKDLVRLEIITDRFSKIGSKPELIVEPVDLAVESTVEYLKPRVSTRVVFSFIRNGSDFSAPLNKPLFSWVLENLIKNAVDAMEGKGNIDIELSSEPGFVFIDIADTGKGIPKRRHKTVFEPGFTTKKRGWGLGLSLTKRIIEQYHGGKIFVLWSEPGKGTTFRIMLKS
jgi:signal transduction histidine kinase